MNLGEYLSNYLKRHNLSYRAFGQKCGLSAGYISMLINNRNPKTDKPPTPAISTYYNIAKAMGISLDKLFSEIDNAPVSLQSTASAEASSVTDLEDLIDLAKRNYADYSSLTLDGQQISESEFYMLIDALSMGINYVRRTRSI